MNLSSCVSSSACKAAQAICIYRTISPFATTVTYEADCRVGLVEGEVSRNILLSCAIVTRHDQVLA